MVFSVPRSGHSQTFLRAELLTGGANNDTFVFSAAGFGHDHITDFTSSADIVELSSTIFTDAQAAYDATVDDTFGNTVITVDASNSITLDGVVKAQLALTDFHIV